MHSSKATMDMLSDMDWDEGIAIPVSNFENKQLEDEVICGIFGILLQIIFKKSVEFENVYLHSLVHTQFNGFSFYHHYL